MQFHAVALLHALRANDRLAISKLVTSLTKGQVRSPLAQCLLVRYVAQVRVPFGLLSLLDMGLLHDTIVCPIDRSALQACPGGTNG